MNFASWTGVPNPESTPWTAEALTTVDIPHHRVRHVARHLTRAFEQWHTVLGRDLADLFCNYLDQEHLLVAEQRPALEKAFSQLGAQVAAALARPFVIVHADPPAAEVGKLAPAYQLVLPSGAIAWLGKGSTNFFLVTCYVPHCAYVLPSKDRWKRVLQRLVCDHAVLDPTAQTYHPAPSTRVRFVTLASWGFDVKLPKRDWRYDLVHWPAIADPEVDKPRPALRLEARTRAGPQSR